MKKILFFIILFCQINCLKAQISDSEIRKVFSAVVLIGDSIPKVHDINGEKYDVFLRNRLTNKIIHYKDQTSGSGFLISKELDDYLVTAEHVARNIGNQGFIRFNDINGINKEIKIRDLLIKKSESLDWVYHPIADVAVLHLNLRNKDSIYKNKIGLSFLGHNEIKKNISSLDRFGELTIFGFPLNHILSTKNYSPITKNLRPASDVISLKRFDKNIINDFFLLDDPSISGFSGGLVMETYHAGLFKSGDKFNFTPSIIGLVHGTVNGGAGGFAAIVPSQYIIETIELAPSFSGKHTYYYPDGSIWSEQMFKNGLLWEVINNFNPKGEPQEKGDLKEGNGTLFNYNVAGVLLYKYYYVNGILDSFELMKKTKK